MAKKINTSAENIINGILNRFEQIPNIFDNLSLYEKQLHQDNPKHLLSVEDCKEVIKKYIEYFPLDKRNEIILETESECLLLLYNWRKSRVVYIINNIKNNSIDGEYINSKMFNKFPYPGIYIDYNFRNTEYYGAFVTYYRYHDGLHLQKRLLLGFVMYDPVQELWGIEPVFFDIINNISVLDSIHNSMQDIVDFNHNKSYFMKILQQLSCVIVQFLSTIIEYYELNPTLKLTHEYKKIPKHNNEYTVRLEINNTINIKKEKIKYSKTENNHNNKSTPKSPHARRAHTRNIAIKNEKGETIGYRSIWISASYIHSEEIDRPINFKNIEE